MNTDAKIEISDSEPEVSQVHVDSWHPVPHSIREALPGRESYLLGKDFCDLKIVPELKP